MRSNTLFNYMYENITLNARYSQSGLDWPGTLRIRLIRKGKDKKTAEQAEMALRARLSKFYHHPEITTVKCTIRTWSLLNILWKLTHLCFSYLSCMCRIYSIASSYSLQIIFWLSSWGLKLIKSWSIIRVVSEAGRYKPYCLALLVTWLGKVME